VTTTEQLIENLTVGQRIGCYEVVALDGDRVAIADHSADEILGTGRTYNPSRRWYRLTSPTLAARIARQVEKGTA
jgi:hypothetical protein